MTLSLPSAVAAPLPAPGAVSWLSPLVRRILAPNPSPMTGPGTNSHLVGAGQDLVLIDPGPDLDAHAAAILAALAPGERIATIIVTHAHLDHSALARPLAAATGAEVLAFGTATDGRRPAMQQLADAGLPRGGEGVDMSFAPDRRIGDGAVVTGTGWQLGVLHTPGHLSNHICLSLDDPALGRVLFSGDHVMGWSSSIVSPPDGDMSAYMAALARLSAQDWDLFLPGHGLPVTDPAARLAELTSHRRMREAEILSLLSEGALSPAQITARLYADTPVHLHPAAQRNVLAHLIDLAEKESVTASADPAGKALYKIRIP